VSKSRLEAFTDAVIAIIMTLLVLELHAPEEDTFSGLLKLDYKFLIYVVSFVSLAIYWNNHHHMLQVTKKVNGRVLWANNFLIFTLSLFPFVTAWMGDHLFAFAPAVTYGIVVLLADVAYYLLAKELIRANGENSDLATLFKKYWKSFVSIGMNVMGILASFIAPILVLVFYIAVLIMWVIPEKRVEKHYH
jgi:uncharacterized membrane protein